MAFKRSFAVLFVLAASVVASPHRGDSSDDSSSKSDSGSCSQNEFWYSTKSCCLPHGGVPQPPSPPSGKSCPPTTWYWHTEKSCCVPNHPPPANPPPPQCNSGYEWNKATQCCEPGSPTSTYSASKPSQTPKGSYPPPNYGNGSPPAKQESSKDESSKDESSKDKSSKDKSSKDQSSKDQSSEDQYSKQGSSNQESSKYSPPKKSSDGNGNNYKKRSAAALCPQALQACPIGLISNDYECLDTTVELRSCGGCASTGKGQNCNAIEGAWNVGCEAGSCAVYTCQVGYTVASDGKSCVQN